MRPAAFSIQSLTAISISETRGIVRRVPPRKTYGGSVPPRYRGDCSAPVHSVYVRRELRQLCAPAGMARAARMQLMSSRSMPADRCCHRAGRDTAVVPARSLRRRALSQHRYGCQRRLNRAPGTGPSWRGRDAMTKAACRILAPAATLSREPSMCDALVISSPF